MKILAPLFVIGCFFIVGFTLYKLKQHVDANEAEALAKNVSYKKAIETAQTENKPILLIFTASWCGPCRSMKKNVYPSPQVRSIKDDFIWVFLDTDNKENQPLAQKYNVRGIPNYVILDSKGKLKKQFSGGRSPSDFASILRSVL